ncbi:glycosyltransferase family 2 protein [Parvibaculum sp.]|uniref:glycosyltransferase family 2 protein n=1 Tax=Parvibaculum sp. TaxID=2024848 RepID=UPI00391B1121
MEKRKSAGSGPKGPGRERAPASRPRWARTRNVPRPLLGELALASGLVLPDVLAEAVEKHRRWGSPIGQVLVSTGALRSGDLARLYGAQRGLPVVDLVSEPRDETLAADADLDFYLRNRCLPWRRRSGETIYVASDPDSARSAIAEHDGRARPVFVASQREISHVMSRDFAPALTDRAVFDLHRRMPESSAAARLSHAQIYWFAALLLAVAAGLLFAPWQVFTAFNIAIGTVFLGVSAMRYASIFVGLLAPRTAEERAYSNHGVPPDSELPVYTIMVPLFREARVLPILARALSELDYPASKLDIKLILEASDRETLDAAKALRLPDHFEFIVVPTSLPQTKPKACNFALPFARGDYLVIYDAEDCPEPKQLKKAVAAFGLGDEKLACVQAQLNYYNWNENWLTRQFAIEYAAFFDLLLPTMVRLGLPIPLGGTSTHFRTSALREAGAWDPNNVTEDADLGIRLALLGYRCGIIQSTTQEEANCRLPNWIRQRSRWIKGWLQTWLVRMRHPLRLYRRLGLKGFISFQILIGGFTLSNIVHPLFYLSMAISLAVTGVPAGFGEGAGLAIFNMFVLTTGYALAVAAGIAAVSVRKMPALFNHALMMPAYWLLISLAAYKALWQLVTRPFHWEKTEHGISRMLPPVPNFLRGRRVH